MEQAKAIHDLVEGNSPMQFSATWAVNAMSVLRTGQLPPGPPSLCSPSGENKAWGMRNRLSV